MPKRRSSIYVSETEDEGSPSLTHLDDDPIETDDSDQEENNVPPSKRPRLGQPRNLLTEFNSSYSLAEDPIEDFSQPSPPPEIIESQAIVRHQVLADGDCGYTAFGITRQNAHELLLNQITGVRNILNPAIQEVLLTEAFYDYLLKNNRISSTVTLENIKNNLQQYASDLVVVLAFIDYDIRDRRIDAGWAHPATLQALAYVQGVALRIYQLEANGEMIPHQYYPEIIPPNAQEETNLLFLNGNHFERIDFIADLGVPTIVSSGVEVAGSEPHFFMEPPRPLDSQVQPSTGSSSQIATSSSTVNRDSVTQGASQPQQTGFKITPKTNRVKSRLQEEGLRFVGGNNELLKSPISTRTGYLPQNGGAKGLREGKDFENFPFGSKAVTWAHRKSAQDPLSLTKVVHLAINKVPKDKKPNEKVKNAIETAAQVSQAGKIDYFLVFIIDEADKSESEQRKILANLILQVNIKVNVSPRVKLRLIYRGQNGFELSMSYTLAELKNTVQRSLNHFFQAPVQPNDSPAMLQNVDAYVAELRDILNPLMDENNRLRLQLPLVQGVDDEQEHLPSVELERIMSSLAVAIQHIEDLGGRLSKLTNMSSDARNKQQQLQNEIELAKNTLSQAKGLYHQEYSAYQRDSQGLQQLFNAENESDLFNLLRVQLLTRDNIGVDDIEAIFNQYTNVKLLRLLATHTTQESVILALANMIQGLAQPRGSFGLRV